MVIAALAWNIKSWFAMMMMHRKTDRHEYVRMEFRRFLNSIILIPAMIMRRARHHHAAHRLPTQPGPAVQHLEHHRTHPLRLTRTRLPIPRTDRRAQPGGDHPCADPKRCPTPSPSPSQGPLQAPGSVTINPSADQDSHQHDHLRRNRAAKVDSLI
jgi:hypothetical protein